MRRAARSCWLSARAGLLAEAIDRLHRSEPLEELLLRA